MVRLTDRPDMTLDVYRGRKTTIQPTDEIGGIYDIVSLKLHERECKTAEIKLILEPSHTVLILTNDPVLINAPDTFPRIMLYTFARFFDCCLDEVAFWHWDYS